MKSRFLSMFFLLAAVAGAYAQATLTFQGVLKNADGTAVDDGDYPITFSIYDVAGGGTPIWSETQDEVAVKGGIYSVVLGSVNPITAPFNQPYYLGIAVDGGAELIPRVQLTAAPYALSLLGESNVFPNAGNVGIGTADPEEKLHVVGDVKIDGELAATSISGAGTPAGIMAPFAGPVANIPDGYLLCDGSAVSSVDYPELFAAIGTAWGDGTTSPNSTHTGTTDFNLPYTNGVFLRGVNNSYGNDPDAGSRGTVRTGGNTGDNVGSYQDDAFENHQHNVYFSDPPDEAFGLHDIGGVYINGSAPSSQKLTSSANGNAKGETRPRNVYVNYIIKY